MKNAIPFKIFFIGLFLGRQLVLADADTLRGRKVFDVTTKDEEKLIMDEEEQLVMKAMVWEPSLSYNYNPNSRIAPEPSGLDYNDAEPSELDARIGPYPGYVEGMGTGGGKKSGKKGYKGGYEYKPAGKKEGKTGNYYRATPLDPYDLGIRFNKISFNKYTEKHGKDPDLPDGFDGKKMEPHHYPIQGEMFEWLSYSDCPSVITEDMCYECKRDHESLDKVAKYVGYPTHPSSDPDDPYWDELERVVDVQILRRNDDGTYDPNDLDEVCLPDIWEGYTLADMAEAVHDEYPGKNQALHIEQAFGLFDYPINKTIIPYMSYTEFVKGVVLLAGINNWAVSVVGPVNFAMKYYFGRARPEELAWKIAQGDLTAYDGVPTDLVYKILGMKLVSQFDFTAYPEGAPPHPAYPAMHSAASAMSMWLPVVLDLTEEELCQAKKVDYSVSMARLVSGVHFHSDNIAGLKLGQYLVAKALPDYLAYTYGSDPWIVKNRIQQYRFDWEDFESTPCFKSKDAWRP